LLVIDYAIDVAGMRIVPASGSTVRVEAACADEVPPLLARPGDSWYRRPGDDEPPVLCVVSVGGRRQGPAGCLRTLIK
jgi:hypothetical protein